MSDLNSRNNGQYWWRSWWLFGMIASLAKWQCLFNAPFEMTMILWRPFRDDNLLPWLRLFGDRSMMMMTLQRLPLRYMSHPRALQGRHESLKTTNNAKEHWIFLALSFLIFLCWCTFGYCPSFLVLGTPYDTSDASYLLPLLFSFSTSYGVWNTFQH